MYIYIYIYIYKRKEHSRHIRLLKSIGWDDPLAAVWAWVGRWRPYWWHRVCGSIWADAGLLPAPMSLHRPPPAPQPHIPLAWASPASAPPHHPTTPPPTYHHYHPPRTIASLCALLPNLGRLGHRPCQSILSPGSDWLADRMTCVTSVVTWSVTGRSAGINIKSRSVGDPACFDFLHTTFPKRRDFLTNKS